MKKLFLFLLPVAIFCSCKKDNPAPNGSMSVALNGMTAIMYQPPVSPAVHGTFSMQISFAVTADSNTIYIPSFTSPISLGTIDSPRINTGQFLQYGIDDGHSYFTLGKSSTLICTDNNTVADVNSNYIVPVGQTKHFVLAISFTPTAAGSYRVRLVNLNWAYTSSVYQLDYKSYPVDLKIFSTVYVAGM